MQVSDTLTPLAHTAQLSVRLIVGGMPYSKQIRSLERGVTILVATPGRLVDLVNRGDVDLSNVEITVLDEADQMADMGFLPIVREILDMTKPNGQRLLFSATLDGDVDTLRRKYLRNPAEHSTAPVHAQVEGMDHHVLLVHPADKDLVTAQIAARDGRTIFFVRTQAGVDRLADHLALQGVPVGALHGGKSQAVRTRTLDAFRNGDHPRAGRHRRRGPRHPRRRHQPRRARRLAHGSQGLPAPCRSHRPRRRDRHGRDARVAQAAAHGVVADQARGRRPLRRAGAPRRPDALRHHRRAGAVRRAVDRPSREVLCAQAVDPASRRRSWRTGRRSLERGRAPERAAAAPVAPDARHAGQ